MQLRLIFPVLLGLVFVACHNQEPSGAPVDAGGPSDTGGDDDGGTAGWDGISIESVVAPDEYSVHVTFDGDPGATLAGAAGSYTLDSGAGSLVIEGVDYDPATGFARLTTDRQKLGITYALAVIDDEVPVPGLSQDFLAADTALLWVYDFSDPGYAKYELVADRVAVGTYCVVYVQQGMSASGVPDSVTRFDELIYPIETELFTDAPDMDGNGRILLLGLDGGGYYGGFFDPTNSYPDQQTMDWWGIHSNEMEMVHINVADGDFDAWGGITPHEFQHLLYHERHGYNDTYWSYHDEGLAECATRAVDGAHPYAVDYYLADYSGLIGGGLSLVNWTYAQYENYVQAYLFWNYVASRLDGVQSFSDFFDLPTGSPAEVENLLDAELGSDFATVQLEQLIATWVRDESGIYGYEDMIEFPSSSPPTVPGGTTSVDLEPFAGAFFLLDEDSVTYPGTEGDDVIYAGIDAAGNVDIAEPFDKEGGALLVFNGQLEYASYPTQHSGPDLEANGGSKGGYPAVPASKIAPTWHDPPPINPDDLEPLHRWREATDLRLATTAD